MKTALLSHNRSAAGLLVLFAGFSASAQTAPSILQGQVTDLSGAAVTGGALDVGERSRILRLEEGKPPPARENELEVPEQFIVVVLANPKKIHDIAVQVIQHLDGRWLLAERDLCAAGKRLDVGGVLGEGRDDLLRDAVLSSYVC
jgi:hypothetical protein